MNRLIELEQEFLELTQTKTKDLSLDEQFTLIEKVNEVRKQMNQIIKNISQ